jgi:gentisate 1,2-dioxygenase
MLVPDGWWEHTILPAVAEINDVAAVQEVVRRLVALGRYLKDRRQRFEVDAARIAAELRIGELLGPGEVAEEDRHPEASQ